MSGAYAKLRRVQTEVSRAARRAGATLEREGLRTARDGANASIYSTPPGRRYVRTGRLAGSLRARRLDQPQMLGVTMSAIWYAGNVERLDGGVGMSVAGDRPRVTGLPRYSPIHPQAPYYGRTGLNPFERGPNITPGGLRALWLAHLALVNAVRRAGRGA